MGFDSVPPDPVMVNPLFGFKGLRGFRRTGRIRLVRQRVRPFLLFERWGQLRFRLGMCERDDDKRPRVPGA
jgi:hypothetical protein